MSVGFREHMKGVIPRPLLVRHLRPSSSRSLLLTFDDGPHRTVTPEVLDRLDAFGAKAVFFLVGRRVDAEPSLADETRRRGHVLGNHTYQHQRPDPWFPAYLADVRRCQQAIESHAGVRPTLFRPPMGHLTLTSLSVSRLLGLRTVNWLLNVRDWACKSRELAIGAAERMVREAAPGKIVLLHDDQEQVITLLDWALPRLRDKGFDLSSAISQI
jgi:peptidoglycan-N-acetylglucosamine deacetylase